MTTRMKKVKKKIIVVGKNIVLIVHILTILWEIVVEEADDINLVGEDAIEHLLLLACHMHLQASPSQAGINQEEEDDLTKILNIQN